MKRKITLLLALFVSLATTVLAAPGTNIALNKKAIASSGVATPSVDGNLGSRWESAQGIDPQWIYVDLGAEYDINQIKISWEAAGAKDFVVQVSNDIFDWSNTVQTVTDNPAAPGGTINDFNYTSGTAVGRFVRIYGTARQLPYGYSIWELEVYGNLTATGTTSTFAPRVSLTDPANNAKFSENQAIAINANASDDEDGGLGSVTKVEFYVDGVTSGAKVGEDMTAPFSYTIAAGLPLGAHTIRAKAFDNSGNFTYTAAYTVNVEYPVITPSCGGLGLDGDYTYKFSWDSDNPTITFIPNPNRPTVGNSTLIFYYGSSATDPLPGVNVTPNVPYSLTAANGSLIYFYYTYNSPSGEKNNNGARFQFTVGSCGITTNLALNKQVMATAGSGSAKDAVDGNGGTRWSSGNDPVLTNPQSIYVDLNDTYDISRVNIVWEGAYAENYTIDVSDDASAWTTIKTVTGNSTLLNDNTSLTGRGRYLRVSGTLAKTGYGYSIWELEAFGQPAPAVLPVSLISFNTKLESTGKVTLNWSTASESNNSHFIVERSTDGKTFIKIAQVASKNGNSNTLLNYSYVDASPQQGVNYYKLTQVDLNGSSKKLDVQSQTVEMNGGNTAIYPNPLTGNTLYLTLPSKQDRQIAISITNLSGKSVYNGLANLVSGNTSISLSSKPAPGLYIIRAEGQAFKLIVE